MRYSIYFLFRLYIVWLVFFSLQRILFIAHYSSDIESFSELIYLPFHAFRMDLSSIAFLSGIPILFISSLILLSHKTKLIFIKITHVIIWFLALLNSIIFASELVSYVEWRSKLSSKIFVHFETPSEIFRTSSGSFTGWFIFYLVVQLICFFILYRYLILKLTPSIQSKKIFLKIGQFIVYLATGSILIGISLRGGLQQIPISATNAYFSKQQIVNDVSVNSTWNFIHMTFQHFKKDIEGMYNQLSSDEIESVLNELLPSDSTSENIKILNPLKPNIIFVTLESWSSEMIESLNGVKGLTPNFDELTKSGVLFTQCYATSTTSETGHTSIFSGYPTVPGISISSESAKCRKLPSIFKDLKKEGYHSAYYFGGNLAYGNIGGYLTEMGVDKQEDENNLDLSPTGKLGIHDEAMFPYFLDEIKSAKRPYIYGLFTQSTHAPYDMPMDYLKGYPKGSEGYVTSIVYADQAIKKFTDQIKLLDDYDNTIVVFVADHGKTHFKNNNIYSSNFFRIPLLIWGGAIKEDYHGTTINKIGSQSDIAKTILNQLNLPTEHYIWSKDLLDSSSPEWALLTTTMSFGLLDTSGYSCYHTINGSVRESSYKINAKKDRSLLRARGLTEGIYQEFRNF